MSFVQTNATSAIKEAAADFSSDHSSDHNHEDDNIISREALNPPAGEHGSDSCLDNSQSQVSSMATNPSCDHASSSGHHNMNVGDLDAVSGAGAVLVQGAPKAKHGLHSPNNERRAKLHAMQGNHTVTSHGVDAADSFPGP